MTDRHDAFLAKIKRLQAAHLSGGAKISEVFRRPMVELSGPALRKRQRTARKAMEKALEESHGPGAARQIASHLTEWFEEAAFLAAFQLDPERFPRTR